MINWDVKAKTALSDEEVIRKETQQKLYHLKYKLDIDKEEYITIATVRPETIMGDTAICVHPDDDSPKYIKEGIPFITQKNIKPNGLSFDDTKLITDTDHEKFYKRSNVAYGDILISMIGANRGMAAIVDDKRVFSIKNVGLIKSSDSINMNYLLYFLKSSLAMKYVLYMSNGGAQEFVGLTALRSFPIPFPTLKEQQTIVRQLDALRAETQKLEAVYQKKLDDLEELKKSILQKAFAGELKTEKAVAV